jgi:hypothetical protein
VQGNTVISLNESIKVISNINRSVILLYSYRICYFYDGDTVYVYILLHITIIMSRDIVVGLATGYGLEDRGVGVPVPVESRNFLLHVVQTGSGVHPT